MLFKPTEKQRLQKERQHLDELAAQGRQHEAAVRDAAAAVADQQRIVAAFDSDNEVLLNTPDEAIDDARKRLFALRRDLRRVEIKRDEFAAAHSDLAQRRDDLEAAEELAAQAEVVAEFRGKAKALLEVGARLVELQAEIDLRARVAATRWPDTLNIGGHQIPRAAGLLPVGFAPGTLTGPDSITAWGAARRRIAEQFPDLLPPDDPARLAVEQERGAQEARDAASNVLTPSRVMYSTAR
jgi:hypothetical protein